MEDVTEEGVSVDELTSKQAMADMVRRQRETGVRRRALELAVESRGAMNDASEIVANARRFYDFMQGVDTRRAQ